MTHDLALVVAGLFLGGAIGAANAGVNAAVRSHRVKKADAALLQARLEREARLYNELPEQIARQAAALHRSLDSK